MSQNDLNRESDKLLQRQQIEIPKNTKLDQFQHLSTETISKNIESKQISGTIQSFQFSQLSSSENIISFNNKNCGSLLTYSSFCDGQFNKPQVDSIQEEQHIDSYQDIFIIPPDNESIEKPFTYDELNRKCKNLEDEVKRVNLLNEKLLIQIANDQNKIKIFEEKERNENIIINQNTIKISSLEDKNQKISLQLQELQKENLNQKEIIQQQQEKINQIQFQLKDQIQQNNQQKLQFQDKIIQNQKQLRMQIQQDKTLKSEIKISNESKQNLKQNELMKIKDQIILYLENELADLRVSNIQIKQDNQNQIKLNTNNSEQDMNDFSKMKIKDQLLPKPQTQKKQLPPQDYQRLIQSQVNSYPKQNISLIQYLNEKNKKLLKSYSNSQRNNQSLSNCSITESVNQNCQTNDNQLFLIHNT